MEVRIQALDTSLDVPGGWRRDLRLICSSKLLHQCLAGHGVEITA